MLSKEVQIQPLPVCLQTPLKLHLAINNPTLLVGGDFDTPVWNAAVFHQSTLNDLFVKGLSLTVGVRLVMRR